MNASPLSVRVATLSDADAVGDVLARSYSALYRGWYRDDVLAAALPAMTRANAALLGSGRYFLALVGARVIACGGWSDREPGGAHIEGRAHLRHFATDPDFINRGAGGAIMAECFTNAARAGMAEMEVISSLTAEAFYAGRGFRVVGPVEQRIGAARFACVLMRRPIAGDL